MNLMVLVLQELLKVVSTSIAIFVIVDPFAVMPVYLQLTDRFPLDAVKRTRIRAAWIAFGILATFALTGLSIFNLFGITLPAFQIAGGILLLLLGIAQLNSNRTRIRPEEANESLERDDVSVFPLGTPLLAGPGAISTVVLYATQAKGPLAIVELVIAIALTMIASYLLLKAAHAIFKVLGSTGLNLVTRLMGLILTSVAVQFILNGVKGSLISMGIL